MPASTRSKDPQPPKTHILDFFYDDDDGCAFTARISDERWHVIVDPERLTNDGNKDNEILKDYRHRLRAVREHDTAEEQAESGNDVNETSNRSSDRDSGIDVSQDTEQVKQEQQRDQHTAQIGETANPALDLQNWILECFASEVPQQQQQNESAEEEQQSQKPQQKTLKEWYETQVRYYEVALSDDGEHLKPVLLEESESLRKRLDELDPHVPLPKTLRSLSIPWIHASEITVLAESEDPPPVHPSLVSATIKTDSNQSPQTYFFKPVDTTQPGPTKREIDLLHKIHSKGLSSQINVPRIHALVQHKDSHVGTMGFLLTTINDPTPLTKLFDSEVSESKRKKWAKESQRIVDLLHEHDIVWGDAKGDNFLVDKDDELWVIDFGGSYTEGWVDAELNETVEGDEMGVERVVNGLLEPDEMTCDPEGGLDGPQRVDEEEAEDEDQKSSPRRKRSRDEVEEGCEGDENCENATERQSKRSRH